VSRDASRLSFTTDGPVDGLGSADQPAAPLANETSRPAEFQRPTAVRPGIHAAAAGATQRRRPLSSAPQHNGELSMQVSGALVAAFALPRLVPNAVSVAVEFGYAGSGWAGSIVFHVWLRRQLRERRMSQRTLAARSGVNHSTISRLLRGDRTPSLETATKLASALTQVGEVDDLLKYLSAHEVGSVFPTKRVEAALRGDASLSEADVRQLMDHYLRRRIDRSSPPSANSSARQVKSARSALGARGSPMLPSPRDPGRTD
jgi:transcriptional regulator with XRE-family HTH domain